MASERAIVDGFCGWISVSPVLTAVEIGEQPVACAPKKRTVLGSTRPSVISSSKAFSALACWLSPYAFLLWLCLALP